MWQSDNQKNTIREPAESRVYQQLFLTETIQFAFCFAHYFTAYKYLWNVISSLLYVLLVKRYVFVSIWITLWIWGRWGTDDYKGSSQLKSFYDTFICSSLMTSGHVSSWCKLMELCFKQNSSDIVFRNTKLPFLCCQQTAELNSCSAGVLLYILSFKLPLKVILLLKSYLQASQSQDFVSESPDQILSKIFGNFNTPGLVVMQPYDSMFFILYTEEGESLAQIAQKSWGCSISGSV